MPDLSNSSIPEPVDASCAERTQKAIASFRTLEQEADIVVIDALDKKPASEQMIVISSFAHQLRTNTGLPSSPGRAAARADVNKHFGSHELPQQSPELTRTNRASCVP
jgi:hypothetical protein